MKQVKLFSSFDRDSRVGRYQVDRIVEDILESINDRLSGMDEVILEGLSGQPKPSILVTGVPRSGTTLITQVLPARYDVAFVSNLMARFYRSPITGAWLQQHLMPYDIHSLREFRSQHGATERIFEPHEFGFFWASYLNSGTSSHEPRGKEEIDRIDYQGLDNALVNIARVFKRPTVYKCAIAPFVISSLMKHTDVFVIHITRDRLSTIDSILRVREQRLGDARKWWSIRPHGWEKYHEKSPQEQVEWQYDRIIASIREGLAAYGNRSIEISLEQLVRSPEKLLEDIIIAYAKYADVVIPKVGEPIRPFSEKAPE